MENTTTHFDLGIVGGGVAVQMALPSLLKYKNVAIYYDEGTPYRYPQFTRMTSVESLFDRERVNALYVASPVNTHLRYMQRACEAGQPVLVEKPLANLHQAVQAAKIADRHLAAVAFRKRFSDLAKTIVEVRSANLESATVMHVTWLASHPGASHWKNANRHDGGGVALDLASHVLDLVEFAVSPVDRALLHHYEVDPRTGTDVYLDFELILQDGSKVTAQVGWAIGDAVQQVNVRHAAVRILWLKDASVPDGVLYVTSARDSRKTPSRRNDEYAGLLTQFEAYVHSGVRGSLASFDDGLRNLALIDTLVGQV